MGAASAVTGGLSAGIGIYQAIQGAKEKRNAKKALENYKRQELENVAEDLQVSTLGADRQLAEQSRLASTQIGALQGGGTRALLGGLGRVEAGNQAVNDQITADLDQQRKQIDQMIASDNANIRSMQENRENADINALSSQYQSGKQDMNMGIGNALQGIGSVANSITDAGKAVATGGLSEAMPSASSAPSNSLSTGVMTSSGGSGMNAVSGFGFDEFGNKIVAPTNTTFNPRRRKFGLGYTENYDGTLNFNN
jgi:hypothetical protein